MQQKRVGTKEWEVGKTGVTSSPDYKKVQVRGFQSQKKLSSLLLPIGYLQRALIWEFLAPSGKEPAPLRSHR